MVRNGQANGGDGRKHLLVMHCVEDGLLRVRLAHARIDGLGAVACVHAVLRLSHVDAKVHVLADFARLLFVRIAFLNF